jgi:hypothetical protein
MRVEKRDGSRERRINTAMVVDKVVLESLAPKWDEGGLFASEDANVVGRLCVEYYKKYSDAPGRGIEALVSAYLEGKPDSLAKPLVAYVGSLSDDFARSKEPINPALILDLAGEHFNAVRLRRLAEEIQVNLEANQVARAEQLRTEFKPFSLEGENGQADLFAPAWLHDLTAPSEDVLWLWKGLLARGHVTLLSAHPKAGKTILLSHLLSSTAQ